MNNPLVSIIVRTKDRPDLLKRALKSISAQTYRPLEVVLVNDGGCDIDIEEIKNILGDVSLNYQRLEKNMGRAHAANTGVAGATGEYVGLLDDDDIFYSDAIKSLMEEGGFRKDWTTYGAVVCKTYMGDAENSPVKSEKIIGRTFDRGRLVFENFMPVNSFIVPRHLIELAGPFDVEFEVYEDWDWLIRLSAVCELHFIDKIISEYSIFNTATITGKGGESFQSHYREKILRKHLQNADAKDLLAYMQSTVDKVVLEKDEKINTLVPILEERESTIAILRRDIEKKNDEALRLAERAKFLEKNIALRDEEIRRLESGIKHLETRLRQNDEEIGSLKIREDKFNSTLQEILSSKSWRLTKPLRAITSIFRKRKLDL